MKVLDSLDAFVIIKNDWKLIASYVKGEEIVLTVGYRILALENPTFIDKGDSIFVKEILNSKSK